MRSAPSVVYPVGRSAVYGWALLGVGVVLVGTLAVWAWRSSTFLHWEWSLLVALAVCWAFWAKRAWASTPEGELQWDALATPSDGSLRPGAWLWRGITSHQAKVLEGVTLVLDWQTGVLLRLKDASGSERWAWATRARAPNLWDDFRRALTSPSTE